MVEVAREILKYEVPIFDIIENEQPSPCCERLERLERLERYALAIQEI